VHWYAIVCTVTGAIEIVVQATFLYRDVGLVYAFKNSFVFKVQMASDVMLALTTTKGYYEGEFYEIVIGGDDNSVSYIRFV
jgi:uncharacterized Fe-S cluster-containing radical SAM superfamily protein